VARAGASGFACVSSSSSRLGVTSAKVPRREASRPANLSALLLPGGARGAYSEIESWRRWFAATPRAAESDRAWSWTGLLSSGGPFASPGTVVCGPVRRTGSERKGVCPCDGANCVLSSRCVRCCGAAAAVANTATAPSCCTVAGPRATATAIAPAPAPRSSLTPATAGTRRRLCWRRRRWHRRWPPESYRRPWRRPSRAPCPCPCPVPCPDPFPCIPDPTNGAGDRGRRPRCHGRTSAFPG
jgi:hypothetical protein